MVQRILAFGLFLGIGFSLSAIARQGDSARSETNRGVIQDGHIYTSRVLGMTITLPGSWEFMEVQAYASPEQKAKVEAEKQRMKAHCSGPLCGDADVKEAFQYKVDGRPIYAVFVLGFKLSAEYQNRRRHPLFGLAQIMTSATTSHGWVVDENLAPIRLSGQDAYRLLVHNATSPQGKGFIYVTDSKGCVFMLVATAMQRPDELQSAVENMKLLPKDP